MDPHLSEKDLLNVSTRCKSFVSLTPDVISLIFERCREARFERGSALMHQGDRGDSLMVLLEGSANVTSHGFRNGTESIARLKEFDVLGEMALLTGEDRTVDVFAETPVRALVLDVDEFQDVATKHPEVGMVLTHLMAERLGEASHDALGGKRIDKYQVLSCAGRGSMAVVYKAKQPDQSDPVALKMMSHRLLYEPGAMQRFQREAELLQELDHDNIARVDRQFTAFRTSFIAMEFCDGPVLSRLVEERGGFPESEVRKTIGQVSQALAHMHGKRIIHRDLKPSNVMATQDGCIKLTDFGLAKPTDIDTQTKITRSTSVLMGTPLYMAPEQLSGEEGGTHSDTYSLGCMTYELLTGRPPFTGNNFFELVQDKLSFQLPAPTEIGEGISDDMHEFLTVCLSHDKSERNLDFRQLESWAAPLDGDFLN